MNAGVGLQFAGLTKAFEGAFPYFYLDIKGYVTIGYGCLVEPEYKAAALTMYHPVTGAVATPAEVVKDWQRVKLNRQLAHQGAVKAGLVAQLRMTSAVMAQLMNDRLTSLEFYLRRDFHQWDSLPNEAQLAILLMAWAIGDGLAKKFPRFTNAVNGGNWTEAARQCKIKGEETNRGLKARNAKILALFTQLTSAATI